MLKLIFSTFLMMLLFSITEAHAQGYLKVEHLTSSELKDDLGNRYGSGDMQVITGGYSLPITFKRLNNGQFQSLSAGI